MARLCKAPEVCDCANTSAHCQHDGKPPGGALCMARDNWHTPPCSVGKCEPDKCWGCADPNAIEEDEDA